MKINLKQLNILINYIHLTLHHESIPTENRKEIALLLDEINNQQSDVLQDVGK